MATKKDWTLIHYASGITQGFWKNRNEAIAEATAKNPNDKVVGTSTGSRRIITKVSVEKSRTDAGYKLYQAGVSSDEIEKRVSIEIKNVRKDYYYDSEIGAWGRVFTSVDGGKWIDEGVCALSCNFQEVVSEIIPV